MSAVCSPALNGQGNVLVSSKVTCVIKTKIVVTVGPACDTTQAIAGLISSGADVLRINFSHGDQAQHTQFLQAARSAARSLGACLAVMGDLCGPKIRLASVSNSPRMLQPNQELTFAAKFDPDDPDVLTTTYPQLIDDVRIGDRLLIDDGRITTRVISKSAGSFRCLCESVGRIQPGQGLNLPDTTWA